MKDKADVLGRSIIYHSIPLLKERELNCFDGMKVDKDDRQGTIKGELDQIGTNFMVTVQWSDNTISDCWVTSLSAIVNFKQWREELINEQKTI